MRVIIFFLYTIIKQIDSFSLDRISHNFGIFCIKLFYICQLAYIVKSFFKMSRVDSTCLIFLVTALLSHFHMISIFRNFSDFFYEFSSNADSHQIILILFIDSLFFLIFSYFFFFFALNCFFEFLTNFGKVLMQSLSSNISIFKFCLS